MVPVSLSSQPPVLALADHAPLLDRGGGEWQVGLDPGPALIFSGWACAALLRALDGTRTEEALCAAGPVWGLSGDQVGGVLRQLRTAGLLSSVPVRPSPSPSVRLLGAGPVGRGVARTLARSGVGRLSVVDDAAPDQRLYPAGAAVGRGSDALVDVLTQDRRRHDPDAVLQLRAADHWSEPEDEPVSLTIVTAETAEVDRAITDHLLREDQPHLMIRVQPSGAVVGPTVVPGRTPCVRCTDLTRRDADPAWPLILAQLCRVRCASPPVLTGWAAAVGAAQALAVLGGSLPQSAGATLELSRTDLVVSWRPWDTHAACGCSWSGPTEWGHEPAAPDA